MFAGHIQFRHGSFRRLFPMSRLPKWVFRERVGNGVLSIVSKRHNDDSWRPLVLRGNRHHHQQNTIARSRGQNGRRHRLGLIRLYFSMECRPGHRYVVLVSKYHIIQQSDWLLGRGERYDHGVHVPKCYCLRSRFIIVGCSPSDKHAQHV